VRLKNFFRQFSEKNFGDMVDSLNSVFSNGITLSNNLSGQIVEISNIPLDTEIQIPHRLGTVPKFRLILRQRGCFILVDGETQWDDKAIYIKACSPASGSVSVSYASERVVFRSVEETNITTPVNDFLNCKKVDNSVNVSTPSGTEVFGVIESGCLPSLVVSSSGGGGSSADNSLTLLIMRG